LERALATATTSRRFEISSALSWARLTISTIRSTTPGGRSG
jgi:hypothetical protein